MILKACLDSDHDSESSSLSVVFSAHQRFAFPVQGHRKRTFNCAPSPCLAPENPDPVSALLVRLQKDALSNIYHAHEVAVVSTHAASASVRHARRDADSRRADLWRASSCCCAELSYFQFSRRRKQSAESFHRMRLQLQWLISGMYVDEPAA